MKILFNDHWEFAKTPLNSSLENIQQWSAVAIPHDWQIYQTENLYENGIGWYKKEFQLEADYENLFLQFDGIYMDSTIYVNGQLAGEWKYGYTTFQVDMTAFAHAGTNEIVVKVVYESPNSRWYSGAGIYRNVYLVKKQGQFLTWNGTYVTPIKESDTNWRVEIDTELTLETAATLKQELYDPEGELVGSLTQEVNTPEASGVLQIQSPKLWDIEQGNLYTLKTELLIDGKVLDQEEVRFGFRTIEMSPTGGFVLNGKRIKIQGACQHHDLGALGAAMNKTALKRQMDILREMGVNAIRTSHNMPAREVMELADEMGFLVQSESFDCWERPKTKYDYARFFHEWVAKDVANWVRRDRNCPSVIMWCIGNEVYDTHANAERGMELTTMLKNLVETHDPKGHAPVTLGSNYMPWPNTRKSADLLKLTGYNYGAKYYDEHHAMHPDWIIYGSETASTVQSRGIYKFPLSQSVLADDDEQCSSLGNSSTSWGAKSVEACILSDPDYSLGQFIWTGTDYIGEPTPYHTKNSYFGAIDTAGFPKDAFYMYKGEWTNYQEAPFVHIFPYWDFSPSQTIDIRVASNAPKVELFFNGDSLGTFTKTSTQLVGNWQLPYEPGTLKAVAYDNMGNAIAEAVQSTFGDAAKITLKADKMELFANGEDMVFVEIGAEDADGNPVANANNRVEVTVTGAGRLVGLDNGDSTDFEAYKGTTRRLFSGKLLAMIASKDMDGPVHITVKSPELPTANLQLQALASNVPTGASTVWTENIQTDFPQEIPIRKIELISEKGTKLDENLQSVEVYSQLLPLNATYQDITWRVTDKAGIDSNIVELVQLAPDRVKLTALGDGTFYLRCMAKNGAEKVRLISQLDFTITGLGEAFLDPYGFIAGGLYSVSNIELTNGNDRGVATDRELVSHVGFEKVDFGEVGADTITLPLFSLMPEPFDFEVWEGMPGEGEKLATLHYDLGSQWNTYREKMYTLPRRLKGITTLSFVFTHKVHIKGFSFQKIEKAYEQISAKNYDYLSGDTFTVGADAIEGIGNNVSLKFENLNFSAGASKLQICGRTPLPKNSIRIQIGESNQLVEFEQSDAYDVQEFELEPISGQQDVTFIFLPGCQFDFKWFKFM